MQRGLRLLIAVPFVIVGTVVALLFIIHGSEAKSYFAKPVAAVVWIALAGVVLGLPIIGPIGVAVRAKSSPLGVRVAVAVAGLCTAAYLLWAYEASGHNRAPTGEGIAVPELRILAILPSAYCLAVLLAIAWGSLAWLLHYLRQGTLLSRASLWPAYALALCVVVASLFGPELFRWVTSGLR